MKRFIFLLTLLYSTCAAYAQKELLVLNEQNQLTYYQVKNIPAAGTLQPTALAMAFLQKNYPEIKFSKSKTGDSSINGNGKMMLYKKAILSSQEDGEVTYSLKIDFKDNRYRIILTNFVYTPYKRTRFGTFAPVSGITIPLDNAEKKLNAKQVEAYLGYIGNYSAYLDQQLHSYLQNPSAKPVTKQALPKVSTTNW